MEFIKGKKYRSLQRIVSEGNNTIFKGDVVTAGTSHTFLTIGNDWRILDEKYLTPEYFKRIDMVEYEVVGDGNNWFRAPMTATYVTNKVKLDLKLTHTAWISKVKLIEIEPDTMESVLRDLIDAQWSEDLNQFVERAKKVLGKSTKCTS